MVHTKLSFCAVVPHKVYITLGKWQAHTVMHKWDLEEYLDITWQNSAASSIIHCLLHVLLQYAICYKVNAIVTLI